MQCPFCGSSLTRGVLQAPTDGVRRSRAQLATATVLAATFSLAACGDDGVAVPFYGCAPADDCQVTPEPTPDAAVTPFYGCPPEGCVPETDAGSDAADGLDASPTDGAADAG